MNQTWSKWRDEIIETISTADMKTEPFCHFFIEPFLPNDMYVEMDQYWPNDEYFWGQCDIADRPLDHENANLKRVMILDDAAGFSGSPQAADFWDNFKMLARDVDVKNAMMQRITKHMLSVRRDLDFPKVQSWLNALLFVDENDFELGPHIDNQRALLSLLLYLPHPDDTEEIGTSIFIPSEKIKEEYPELGKEFTTVYHKDEDFVEVYRAPYRRNCLFGFINDPRAFHGVKRLEGLEKGRRNILWNIVTTEKDSNPYPSALERIKKGITLEMVRESRKKEQMQARLEKFLAAKKEF